jgi:hypothetical protein
MHVTAVGCLVVVIATVGLAPSSQDLHSRYGRPDIERFTVAPGISLTVEYGSDRQACELRIEPTQSLIHSVTPNDFLMPEAEVSKVIEEVAPAGSRGKLIKTGGFQASCGLGNIAEYENVSILRESTACSHSSPYTDVGTMVVFKRDICRIPKDNSGVVIWP